MSFVTDRVITDGIECEYIKFGSGNNTLVILPGLSVQSLIPLAPAVEKQYEIFNDGFTVYLIERRKNPPEEYSVYGMADDTARVMQYLGIKNACIFGASQGGMLAMCIAVKYPELVEKVVLGSTAARVDESRSGVLDGWISLAEKGESEALYLSFGEKIYPEKVFEGFTDAFKDAAKTVSEEELKRFVIIARATRGFDITERLCEIKCPVLLIGDDSDAVLGTDASKEIEDVLGNRDNFESFIYSSFGHAVYDTAPDYTERLYKFFKNK